jgi:hypothetical protein
MAILRMLKAIDTNNKDSEIQKIVSTPQPDEDMVYATDRWMLSLAQVEYDARELIRHLISMAELKR